MMTDQPSPQSSGRHPRSFHVVVKPIGAVQSRLHLLLLPSQDNLLADGVPHRIADDLLEEFIGQYIAGQQIEEVTFNWHGGEPMLLGLDFFRKVVELQRKYAGTKRVGNDLQTNGVLLDDAWCEFLKEHRFYVGLSIDGPKHLHDQFRQSGDTIPVLTRWVSCERVPRMARLARLVIPGMPHHVTQRGNRRQQTFFLRGGLRGLPGADGPLVPRRGRGSLGLLPDAQSHPPDCRSIHRTKSEAGYWRGAPALHAAGERFPEPFLTGRVG